MQMICDKWKAKMPGATQPKAGNPASDFEDAHILMGTHETRGNICVCPALQIWLGEELGREASAAKE